MHLSNYWCIKINTINTVFLCLFCRFDSYDNINLLSILDGIWIEIRLFGGNIKEFSCLMINCAIWKGTNEVVTRCDRKTWMDIKKKTEKMWIRKHLCETCNVLSVGKQRTDISICFKFSNFCLKNMFTISEFFVLYIILYSKKSSYFLMNCFDVED